MRNQIRKLFALLIAALSVFVLGYGLALYARHQMDGLQALFCIQAGMLSVLWFGLQSAEPDAEWPISIRPAARPVRVERERRSDWVLCEQKAA